MRKRGCVKQYGSGLFLAKFDLPRLNGVRKQVLKRGFGTDDEAQDWIDEQLRRVRQGTYVEPSRITFAAYAARWLEFKFSIRKGSTCRNYESYLKAHISPVLGQAALSKIHSLHLKDLIQILTHKTTRQGTPLKPKTIRNVIVMLREMFADAVSDHLIEQSPAASLKKSDLPSMTKYRPLLPTVRELRACFDGASLREKIVFFLEVMTGLRRGEICGLQWSDVDWLESEVTVQRSIVLSRLRRPEIEGRRFEWVPGPPKSDESVRTICLHPAVLEALKLWRQQTPESLWIFSGEDGGFIRPDDFTKNLSRPVLEKATKGRVTKFHSLRHMFSTILQHNKVDAKTVQTILGHPDPGITVGTYTHASPESQREAGQVLYSVLFPSGLSVNAVSEKADDGKVN